MDDNVALSTFLKNREKLFISFGKNTVSLFQELKVCVQILTDSLVEMEEKGWRAVKGERGGRGKEVTAGARGQDDKMIFLFYLIIPKVSTPRSVHQ